MSDIVEHLRDCAKYADEYPSDKDAFNGAAKEITRLREENARLREALKPFAYIAEQVGDEDARWAVPSAYLRAAAAAIREGGKDDAP